MKKKVFTKLIKGSLYSSILGRTLPEILERPPVCFFEEPALIEDIAGITYCSFRRDGLELSFRDQRASSIKLFSAGYDGYEEFQHPIGWDLTFASSRKDVRAVFTEVSASRDQAGTSDLGPIPAWDRFEFEDHSVHFQYSDRDLIELVTFMHSRHR